MKGGTYTKTLAKIQVRGIFRVRDHWDPKKCFTQTYRDLYGDAMLVFTWMSSNMADGSVTEFCYKSVNLFLEKLINIKVILFLIHELFR